ncbi:RNA polymerase II-associated protein 1 [Folsomia candida]|uniref:RNA polymerase II-associated protein 1 n=1 Tax=Folsomia candida TaxID=158441 RepID=A0A226EUD6_FOLCA|nr:RNA polymerase II-associated protein 1 [Folsomia candida]
MYEQKRPKPGEDEEAILALEKDFISSVQSRQGKFKPAATAVRKDKKGTNESINMTGPVETTSSTSKKQTSGDQNDVECESDDEKIEGTGTEASAIEDENEVVIQNTIVERTFDASKLLVFSTPQQQPLGSVKTVGKSLFSKGAVLPNSKMSRKSMFAQMFDARYSENNHDTSTPGASSSLVDSSTTQLSTESVPSSGKAKPPVIGDMIHPYLAGMTQAEIMVEQQKLVQTLDPRLVEFVRSRQAKKQIIIDSNDKIGYALPMERPASRNSDKVVNDVHFPTISNYHDMDESDLPIDPKSVISFPGMGHLEYEKLEWAGVVKENRKKFDKLGEGKNARFDFRGMLLTGKDLEDTNTFEKGLHHHGEDMEKPGYTLEELLTLSRSVNSQQKAQALLTIGNIYENAHTGMYDFVLEKSLFELWEHMDFVYALRKGLDEGDKTSINEAVHCLSNIMYPWEEEASFFLISFNAYIECDGMALFCLDFVHSWEYSKPYPWISTKSRNLADSLDPGEDEVDLKDEEMLKIDFLEFFINRSNLLDRIAYFLKGEDCLSEKGMAGIFKMLIRVARHSPNILVDHEVLSIIVKNYISPILIYSSAPTLQGVPVWMAFKIFRILIDSSSANAYKIYEHYNIFPSVISYLAFDDW